MGILENMKEKIKKKKIEKENKEQENFNKLPHIACEYDAIDLSEKSKLIASKEIFEKINKLITNGKTQINGESISMLENGLTHDNYYEFYDSWISYQLEEDGFLVDNSDTDIENFTINVNKMIKKCGYDIQLDVNKMVLNYMEELKAIGIEEKMDYDILIANVIAKELRTVGYELVPIFSGFDNNDFFVISKNNYDILFEIEKNMKNNNINM